MTDRTAAFLAVLESLGMAARFQQGRRLARAGAVRGLVVTTSVVIANVRDADPAEAHRVRIAVRAFSAAEWHRVQVALEAEAIHVAKLLAGEVPDGLDSLLAELGLSLLPQSVGEVALSCSCRGWQEPCAHVIATWYALADEFARDPFTMFAWRGRPRGELLEQLHEPPSPAPTVTPPTAPGSFWVAGPRAAAPTRPVGSRRPDSILDQLDRLPLTVGRHEVTDLIRPVYERVAGRQPPQPGSTVDR
jgi:uncharacterized Zn finger protein